MPKRSKLQAKYKVRRMFLLILLLALVGVGGWCLGQGGFMKEKATATVAGAASNDPSADLSSQPIQEEGSESEEASREPEVTSESSASSEEPQEPEQASPGEWRLLQVGPGHPLPDGFQVDLSVLFEHYKLDSRIVESARRMFTDAKIKGVTLIPESAYRDAARQEELIAEQVQALMTEGKSEEEARALALRQLAEPGMSEHETGLALDILSDTYQELDEGFAKTEAYRWLSDHAHEYGFVLRYPQGKEDLTGIDFEPWHYRFVGVEHAAVMKERGLCLEEYLYVLRNEVDVQGAEEEPPEESLVE